MQKIVLDNGLTVIYQERDTNSVAVEVMVKVGSNDEKADERGISHFIEHMVFEGTKKRGDSKKIANEIEKIGGELNAYTSNERTCFFAKVLKKQFDVALDVLSDIVQNPLFREEDINKEKKIVEKEIDMVNDEPRFYQWVVFENNLYDKHPVKYPTYGSKKVIEQLDKKQLEHFYNKYYHPNNMVLAITGTVDNWKEKIKEKFIVKKGKLTKKRIDKEAQAKKNRSKKEKRKITNSYLVIGYRTVPRKHKDSYALDVIHGILGRGQSGTMFNEIRGKRGIAYEVGTNHVAESDYGYFSTYLSCEKKNINKAKSLILKELEKIQNVTEKDIRESKEYIEGDYLLEIEDNQKLADNLCFWEQMGDAKMIKEYIEKIKEVSIHDVKRTAKKYFKKYCLVVIEGK